MHRVDSDGHNGNMWQDGNPGGGVAGTLGEQHWHNAVQEELVHIILTKAGITLVKGTWTQLGSALDMIMQGVSPGGRLTLETGVGVSTADQAGKTTVYYTPFKHNRIAVYDGTRWVWRSFTELSQATTDNTKSPAAVANNSNYDVFAWLDGSTMRATRGPAWTGDTARGTGAGTTELEFFEWKWVNKVAITNGPAARCGLYVGTIRSDGSAQINDTLAKRHVWNTYNRVPRPMKVVEGTDSWTYSTTTFRQANNSAANQLDMVAGLAEDAVNVEVIAVVGSSATESIRSAVGIGVDSTVANSATAWTGSGHASAGPVVARYDGVPGIGRHTLTWLEWATNGGGGQATFYGDNGGSGAQAGITAVIQG
jgi:hypothetical protein